ncbi:hypothetical protein CLV51_103588 [Chitinophaga niastensis]|uniref:CCDC81-like prokaryotic HU domain-containing protein n=1 Tax=Chitinophaga niastensis TaxID=536980 RepID=A0A2P8HK63_CHINA|nr:hypothetical protein [Chitinophaga niastensis]PSL46607.1 hypothetical protein CLV51_103588 [Chitinophaga niastensis]
MILQQYIQEVLFKQRVCVVPQLGTFTVQHFPAQYNVAAHTLTAPREQVIFTQQWQDDGSCLEWIALKENLVPAVAQRKMEKYLEELKTTLQSGKPLVLPGIGQLQGDFTGNIHFHAEILPVEQESIPITPIQRQETKAPAPAPQAPPPVTMPLEPMMTEEMEDTLEAVTEEGGFKWWWAGIPIAMVVIGLATWWYVSSQAGSPGPQVQAVNTDSIKAKQLADSIKAATPVTPPPPDTLAYFAVVEEFKDSVRAARQTAKRQAWKQEVVMYKRGNSYKVAAPIRSIASDTTAELEKKKVYFKNNRIYLDF